MNKQEDSSVPHKYLELIVYHLLSASRMKGWLGAGLWEESHAEHAKNNFMLIDSHTQQRLD
jgi:hypothetical protein